MTAQAAAEEPPSDSELALRIGQRDGRAFETMMRSHNQLLYRLARSILKDDSEAEDAVQEAYLAAYRGISGFRGGAKLSTWLARIVINEAYGRLRKKKRSSVVVPLGAPIQGGDRGESSTEGTMADENAELPESAALRGELRRLLEREIDALPEQFRTVFILRDVEELSVEETAQCLDLPPATVRTRAFRARALLRASLSREIDTATLDAFAFAGERCNRIVANVMQRLQFFNLP